MENDLPCSLNPWIVEQPLFANLPESMACFASETGTVSAISFGTVANTHDRDPFGVLSP